MSWKALAVALCVGVTGAAGCDTHKGKRGAAHHDEDAHAHGAGPHGGVIFDLGKHHGEFRPDHAKKEATVWVLGADEKTPRRVKAEKLRLVVSNTAPPIEVDLLPVDAADGTASAFAGRHEGFGVEQEYKGTVSGQIDGKAVSGEFEEKPAPKK